MRSSSRGLQQLPAIAVAVVLGLLALPAVADDERAAAEAREAEQSAALRAGIESVVAAINVADYSGMAAAIDSDDMLDRIFGLRLIDPRIKKSFGDQFEGGLAMTLERAVAQGQQSPVKARLLGFASRGDRGRAVVRYELENFQFAYHEYELRLDDRGRFVIVDWLDFFWGERFSDGVGLTLVTASPGKPAVRKLIDAPSIGENDIFQVSEVLKALRDFNVARYFEVVESMPEKLKRQRVVVLGGVQMTKRARARRQLRTALVALDQYYPDEPLYANLLLDYYFPVRRYDDAKTALLRLNQRLDVEDAAHEARMSSAELVSGNVEAAVEHADRAIELDPEIELGWWSALRARASAADYAGAVTAIDKLAKDFGHELNEEALSRDRSLQALVASPEFTAWTEGQSPAE